LGGILEREGLADTLKNCAKIPDGEPGKEALGKSSDDAGLEFLLQTGTETREVPTYRIECPDGSAALTLEE